MLRYLLLLALFAVSVHVLMTGLSTWVPAVFSVDYVIAFTCYFFLLTLLFHFGLERASVGKPSVFIRYYMGATTLKLFIHLGVLLVFALSDKSSILPFAVTFMGYYLLYTAFEVVTAFRRFSAAK